MNHHQIWIEYIKALAELSSTILNWTISLLIDSILVITSISYEKTSTRNSRFTYLLFIPGWILEGYLFSLSLSQNRT